MVELFKDVPQKTKDRAKFWVDILFAERNVENTISKLAEFRNSLQTDEEKDFLDFYVNMRLELEKNEQNISNNDSGE